MALISPAGLTAAQSAIWLDQQLFPNKPIYNTGSVITIRGPLQLDLFEAALRETIAESPCLQLPPRSQRVSFNLPVLDFRDEQNPDAAAESWMRAQMREPILLDGPSLFRFALIRVGKDRTLWFKKYHHIIIDATSRLLLAARTAAHYRALRFGERIAALEAATPEDLLKSERDYAASKQKEIDRQFWMEQFARWPAPLMEVDRRTTARVKTGRPARHSFKFKRADFERLDAAARALGSTPARAAIALVYAAFARLYDRSDLVIGVPLAFRSDPREKNTIGLLAHPIPIHLKIDPAATLADAVRHVDEIRARAYPHRHFPFQEITKTFNVTRNGQYSPFDVMVNYTPSAHDFAFETLPVEAKTLSNGFVAPWMVTIFDSGLGRDLDVNIDIDPSLIPVDMAKRLVSYVEILLLHGLDDPACPIASLPVLSESDRIQVLGFAAGETVPLTEQTTLASLCAMQAERTPEAVALIHGDQYVTYATLHERAARLARRLAALGVKPGVVVGIALPREPSLVVAVLAVHKAGGAYLALDPSYPAERIQFFVADSATPVIITNTALAPIFAGSGVQIVFDTDEADVGAGNAELVAPRPDDLAYVLYTSGSTGRPKAVGIEHRNLVNLVSWARSIVSESELSGLLFSTSLNFDLSAFEMFLPHAFGGCIVLVENLQAVQSAPHRDKVRLINTGPSLIDALLRTGGLPAGVKTIILAGEKLTRHLADAIFKAVPGVRLLNCYGPTETTVYSSCAAIDPADRSEPAIGRAIWNTTLYALDSRRELVPVGTEGELFIGGAGVARGYIGRPELTAERFLPNRFGSGQLYRTGDRVRWRTDGELEFLGRVDNQLKINGVRVEPGEIEAALLALPGIAAAAVKLCEDNVKGNRLAAYLVPAAGGAPLAENVRAALQRQLPPNMIPSAYVWLEAMPMTPNGKLDRKALPAPSREQIEVANDRPPQTELEQELADIWEEVLERRPDGVRSDFYDLGGDSLALASLFAAIEARLGRRLNLDVLAGGLTIADLAQFLSQDENPMAESDPTVALQPLGHLPPFFCIHGVAGNVFHLQRLALNMGTDRPFIGLRQPADARGDVSIPELAARYVSVILERDPNGPYFLGGASFGATLAYEVATQLVEAGHEVGLLALIDQRRPGFRITARTVIPFLPRILVNIPRRLGEELSRVPRAQRPQQLRRTLLRWLKIMRGQRVDATLMFQPNEPRRMSTYETNLRAVRDYRPRPLAVPIVLFRAREQMLTHFAMDTTLGWKDLALRGVRVHIIPGDHATIITEPNVRELAKALSKELDAAQGAALRVGLAAE